MMNTEYKIPRKCAVHQSELGILSNPDMLTNNLAIDDIDDLTVKTELATLFRIRAVEEVIADLAQDGEIKTPVHLCIGQEAIAVGISRHLRTTDRVYSGHRSHAHYVALGGNIESLISEIMCRENGCSAGRGGSMHLYADEVGFSGSVPLVGATIPLAVGAALAAKMDRHGDIAVAYFGDGACEEGVLHESLNLAAIFEIPVLFVVENNLYSSHLDIALRQPSDRVARFAEAHRIEAVTTDGNDLVGMANTAGTMIERMRSKGGPGFIEAITYRWRGHVGPDVNVDVGVRRSIEEVKAWKNRDPIRRLADALISKRILNSDELSQIEAIEKETVRKAVETARAGKKPNPATVCDHVYHEGQVNE